MSNTRPKKALNNFSSHSQPYCCSHFVLSVMIISLRGEKRNESHFYHIFSWNEMVCNHKNPWLHSTASYIHSMRIYFHCKEERRCMGAYTHAINITYVRGRHQQYTSCFKIDEVLRNLHTTACFVWLVLSRFSVFSNSWIYRSHGETSCYSPRVKVNIS